MSNKVRSGEAYVSVSADNSKLKAGLKQAKTTISSFAATATISVGVSVAGLGYSLKQLANLQDQMLILQGVTGKTASDVSKLEEQAKELGKTTSWTADQVASGMVSLSRMGMTLEQVNTAIEPTMNLAKGLGVEVSAAADMLGSVLNQFKKSASDAANVADVLAKATNGAAISQDELATSLKYAGTSGAQMGQSLETVTAMVMQLRNLGYDAQQAGTIVRGFFLDLQDPKKQAKFTNVFGVELKDAAGNFRPFLSVLSEAQAKANALGTDLTAALRDIGFTKATVGGIQELMSSVEATRALSDSLKDCKGYASDLAGTMDSGLSGSVKIMRSAVDGLAISVGEALEDKTVEAVKGIGNLASAVTSFVNKNKPLVSSLASAGASFSVLSLALGGVMKFGGLVGSMLKATSGMLAGVANSARSAAGALGLMNTTAEKSATSLTKMEKTGTRLGSVMKSVGSAMTSMLAITAVVEAAASFADWLSRGASHMKAVADEAERARDALKDAYSMNNTKEGVESQVNDVEAVLSERFKYSDLTDRERVISDRKLERLKSQGVIDEATYSKLSTGGSFSAQEQKQIMRNVVDVTLTRAEESGVKAKEALNENTTQGIAQRLGFSNMTSNELKELGRIAEKFAINDGFKNQTNIQATAEEILTDDELKLVAKANGGKLFGLRNTLESGFMLRNVLETYRIGNKGMENIAADQSLTDAERAAKAARFEEEQRKNFANAKASNEYFGAGRLIDLDRKQQQQISDALDFASTQFSETIRQSLDEAKTAQYAADVRASYASKESPASLPAMPVDMPLGGPIIPPSTYDGDMVSAQKAAVEESTETIRELEEASEHANEVMADILDYAKETKKANEAQREVDLKQEFARLTKAFKDNGNPAIIADMKQVIQNGQNAGMDMSNEEDTLMDIFSDASEKMAEAVKQTIPTAGFQSKVFSDSISAAFSASNVNALEFQRQQLLAIRELITQAHRQFNISAQILDQF